MTDCKVLLAELTRLGDIEPPQGTAWRLGEAFAFYTGENAEVIKRNGGSIVPLSEPCEIQFGNSSRAGIIPTPTDAVERTAISTDREVYRVGRDRIRLLVHSPSRPDETMEVVLTDSEGDLRRGRVSLDPNGVGLWETRGLEPGLWTARAGGGACQFTITDHRLSPFAAEFVNRRIERGDARDPEQAGRERLYARVALSVYSLPFKGQVRGELLDLGDPVEIPTAATDTVMTDEAGEFAVELPLEGRGPFALRIQEREGRQRHVLLPLPDSGEDDRHATVLAHWGDQSLLRVRPFPGSTEIRGLYLGSERGPRSKAPIKLQRVGADRITIKTRSEIESWAALVLPEGAGPGKVVRGDECDAGDTFEVPLEGPWAVVLLGVMSFGNSWEGRAVFLRPCTDTLKLELPERAEPDSTVELGLIGRPGATVLVSLRDQRLPGPRPIEAASSALRRALDGALARHRDVGWVDRSLSLVLASDAALPSLDTSVNEFDELADPFKANPGDDLFTGARRGETQSRNLFGEADPFEKTSDSGSGSAGRVRSASEAIAEAPAVNFELEATGAESRSRPAAPAPVITRDAEVRCFKLCRLDEFGRGSVILVLPNRLAGWRVNAVAFSPDGEVGAETTLTAARACHGRLELPRFVSAGDHVEGRLFVSLDRGDATVTVLRDGERIPLRRRRPGGPVEEAERLTVSAPDATITFAAGPGQYEARVVAREAKDVTRGRVDRPGRRHLRRTVLRFLQPGEAIDAEPERVKRLRVLPSLDACFERVLDGLLEQREDCCETVSAVALAAATRFVTTDSEERRAEAADRLGRALSLVEKTWVEGKGFKGWPDSPDSEIFPFSPATALNLLDLANLRQIDLPEALSEQLPKVLEMAEDAARAHKLETAPERPASPRHALERFRAVPEDQARMVDLVLELIEETDSGDLAITQFDPPELRQGLTFHLTPALIRAQTAYAATLLLEAGGPGKLRGLRLACTILDALEEHGALFSTLDSVAALTLLSTCRRLGLPGNPESTRVEIDGERLTVHEASLKDSLESVTAIDQPILVELTVQEIEDWTRLSTVTPPKVRLLRPGTGEQRQITALGEAVDLEITLADPYECGDRIDVVLPAALSSIAKGPAARRLSFDLRGESSLTVPVAATALTLGGDGGLGPQRFAVILRNAYDEERGAARTDIEVLVQPARPEASS